MNQEVSQIFIKEMDWILDDTPQSAGIDRANFLNLVQRFSTVEEKEIKAREAPEVLILDPKSGRVTTMKVTNLRFRLKEFGLELLETFSALYSTSDNLLAALFVIIRSFQRLKQLSTIELRKADAQILRGLLLLAADQDSAPIEALVARLGRNLSENEVSLALDRLIVLGCIEKHENGFEIVEEFVLILTDYA